MADEPDRDLGSPEEDAELDEREGNVEEEVETEETGEEPETEEETEPQADAETEGEAEPEPSPKPQSRAQRRIQALDERLRQTQAQLEELRRQPRQGPDPAAAAEAARREREEDEQVVLSGDPARISQHFAGKVQRQVQGQIGQLTGFVADSADRTEFRSLCAENPAVAAVKDEVERRLATARQNGLNPRRDALAFYILGERMANRAKGARTRQEKRAGTERQRQQARPGAARSDVASRRERQGQDTHAARAKRLDESGML